MFELLIASADADILQADVSKPPPVCDCPPGHPEFVEHRSGKRDPTVHLDASGNRYEPPTLVDKMRVLGFTEACPRGYWNNWVWCGAKGALPICADVACGPGRKELARLSESESEKGVPGAEATCRVYQPSGGFAATVWCEPAPKPEPLDLPIIDLPDAPEAPKSPPPGSCSTGGLPASLLGLVLLALASPRRRSGQNRR